MFWNNFPHERRNNLARKLSLELYPLTDNQREELILICNMIGIDSPRDLDSIRVLQAPVDDDVLSLLDMELNDYYIQFATEYDALVRDIEIGSSDLEFVDLLESDNIELVDRGDTFKKSFKVRNGFAARFYAFCASCKRLNLGVRVLDAFRSFEVQKSKFENTLGRLAIRFPDMSDEDRVEMAAVNTACSPWIAAHMSGAAIDLYLFDLDSNKNLDMGNEYRSLSCITNMNFPFLSFEQFKNRFIFQMLSDKHGFAVYHAENWHVSYGDLIWAKEFGKCKSLYEPVRSIDSVVKSLDRDDFYTNFNEILC